VGIESTVLDLSGGVPTILRPGGLSREQIESIIGPVDFAAAIVAHDSAASSPGQHARHYAPRTPAIRVERHELSPDLTAHRGFIVLGPISRPLLPTHIWIMAADPVTYARDFYTILRGLDALGLEKIVIEMPPDEPEWAAIRDRIIRATSS
jgi:L-threonylcarbamoyladenylate synthase